MPGIIYTRYRGAVILYPQIKGEVIKMYTPLWLMREVIDGKRKFGHFNPESDLKKEKEGAAVG